MNAHFETRGFGWAYLRYRESNIQPKIKNAMDGASSNAKSHVQVIAYVLIAAFFLLAMVYVYETELSQRVDALLPTFTALEDDSYK